MADREFIEFVLTATDLASRKLNAAAAAVERETAKIEASTKGASREFDKLGESMDRTGGRGGALRRSLSDIGADMEKAEAKLAGYEAALRRVPDAENLVGRSIQRNRATLLQHIEALKAEATEVERFAARTASLPGAIERFSASLLGNVRALRSHSQTSREASSGLGLLTHEAANALRGMDALGRGVKALGRGLVDLLSGVGKTGKELDKLAADADRQVTKWERLGSAWGRASSGILSVAAAAGRGVASLGAMGLIIAGLPFIIEGIAGTAEAAAGGIFALASALSTLSATAVVLPAVLTGVVGSIAAITTILKPAVSGVLAFVSAAGKAQQGATGSTGGTAVQTPAQLEKQLHLIRIQNALQEKQAEQQLALLKINTAQTLIQDQKTLDNLRAQDRISEQNAQADLKNAKAKLRQLEQQGAPQAEIKAAQAEVAQDEENLHKTKLQNQQAESQAAAKLQHDKVNGIAQIKAAEIQLQLLQISNAQQVASLQHQIAQGQSGALSRQADLFKHLTPLQQQLATGILNLKKRWDELTASFKNRFIRQLLIDLKDLNTFLPVIAKTVGGFANTITDTIGAITQQLVSPNGQPTALGSRLGGFVTFIEQQQRLAIGLSTSGQAAGGGLLALGDAITRFVTSPPAEKFIHFLTVGVNQLGAWALNAEKAGEQNGSIARFFQHAREVAGLVGKIAENLGAAVFNIGKISFPTGAGFLESLKQLTGRFRAFTETAKGRNEIRRYFDDARDAIHHLNGALEAVLGLFGKLGRTAIAQGGGQGGAPTVRGGRAARGPISARTPSGLDQFFDLIKSAAPVAEKFMQQFVSKTGPAIVKFLKAAAPFIVRVSNDLLTMLGYLGDLAGFLDKHPEMAKLTAWFVALVVVGGQAVPILFGVGKALIFILTEAVIPLIAFLIANPIVALILAIAIVILLIVTHWNTVKRVTMEVLNFLAREIGKAWGFLKRITGEAWGFVKDLIVHHWQDILAFFAGPLGLLYLVLKFTGIWDTIKKDASKAWDAITGVVKTAFHDLVGWATNTAPGAIKRAFEGIWNGIKDVTGTILYHVFEIERTFVNDVVGAINWVYEHIPGTKGKLLGGIPDVSEGAFKNAVSASFAEGGIYQPVPGGMYRFVEAGHAEAIVPLDPSKRDRAVEIMRQVASHLGTPGFAGGGIAGGGQTGVRPHNDPVTGAIDTALSTVGGWISAVKDHLPSIPNVAGVFGKVLGAAGEALEHSVVQWGEREASSVVGSVLGALGIGGATGSVTPQTLHGLFLEHKIDAANRYLGINWGTAPQSAALHRYPNGVPPWGRQLSFGQLEDVSKLALGLYNRTKHSDLIAFIGRALQESGGYTSVINQWDSNWSAGTPSIGLLQTIGPTFGSYLRRPFTNIWDPLHNAVAAIGYMLAGYHRIVGPSGSGYALGGPIGDHMAGFTAGLREGQPVRILAHVGEWVLNRDQQDKLAHVFGSRDKAFHALFTRPSFGGMFAAGGLVTGLGAAPAIAGGGAAIQVGPIHTTSPEIDIDYVVRAIELRLGRFS